MAGATLGMVVLLGMTGVITALGDTLFPARSFAEGFARDFDSTAHFFVRLRVWHPALAAIAGLWILYYASTLLRSAPRLAVIVIAALLAQILAGVSNLLLAAPVWLQMIHLLLADTLWISLVLLTASIPQRDAKVLPNLRRSVAM
jgi:heme A synthase